ncbi:hypothetical protein AKJ16_DCAP02339 [Drosera capensis]
MRKPRLFVSFLFSLSILHHLLAAAASASQQDREENAARTHKQQQTHTHEVHCSRERSRAAWKVIEEYLMPFVEKEKYQISRKCKLHPDNDMFRDQEQHKVHFDIHELQCGYCKKSFYEEKYLDMHFDNRHYDLLNQNGSRCLADLCGALHCDLVMDIKRTKQKCNPAAATKSRQLCESLADSFFPISGGPSSSRLHEAIQHILPFNFHFDPDAAAFILCACVFIPKGTEKWYSRSQANFTDNTQEEALLKSFRSSHTSCCSQGSL